MLKLRGGYKNGKKFWRNPNSREKTVVETNSKEKRNVLKKCPPTV